MKTLLIIIISVVTWPADSCAQIIRYNPGGDSTIAVTLEGYADLYFGFDFDQPKDGNRPYFVSHVRHNEFNVNLAYLGIKYTAPRARASFTPGFGTYMNANYAAERLTLQNVVDAYVGVKLFKNRDIWIDAGVFGAPYTTESAIAFDQFLYTRSFAAEYSPYYLTGGKMTVPLGKKVSLYLYLINGWQVIVDSNAQLSMGSQLEIKPSKKLTINWNTYVGNEHPVSSTQNKGRYFIDMYCIYTPSEKLALSLDVYGGRQKLADSILKKEPVNWGQANVNARYFITNSSSVSARAEYYRDLHSVFIVPITGVTGFDCASFSLGYNLQITKNVVFRVEGRYFTSSRNVFYNDKLVPVSSDELFIGGLIAKF
jgi:hypothetical protein